jgi:hypothetical protein
MNGQTYFYVVAPLTPGAAPSPTGHYETLEQARSAAARFADRKDLRMQDVSIRRCTDMHVEHVGPCR